jgi:tRNA A-37 threonylcarbamoyl transferase component Bud32
MNQHGRGAVSVRSGLVLLARVLTHAGHVPWEEHRVRPGTSPARPWSPARPPRARPWSVVGPSQRNLRVFSSSTNHGLIRRADDRAMISVDRARPLAPGSPLSEGRHVLKHLGGGDRYEAYVAWDDRLHTTIVAKALRPHLLDDERALGALRREAHALERLAHPDLVRGFGAVLDGPRPHLVLEYLDGPRLSTLVRRFGPLSPEQLVLLGRRLAGVLAYLETVGWVHLDVKPRNIVMTASPKLIDLSVARPIDDARGRPGIGTDLYMAPEQADPTRAHGIGPRSDVWGLSVTLHEAVTGEAVFVREIGADRFPQLTALPPALPHKVPPVVAELILAGLAPDPLDRPAAAEFVDRLEPLLDWAARSARRIR